MLSQRRLDHVFPFFPIWPKLFFFLAEGPKGHGHIAPLMNTQLPPKHQSVLGPLSPLTDSNSPHPALTVRMLQAVRLISGANQERGDGLEVESMSRNPEGRGSIPRLGSRRSSLISIEHAELLRSTPSLVRCCVWLVTMALHVHCGLGQLSPLPTSGDDKIMSSS